jgi:hypothetical protein
MWLSLLAISGSGTLAYAADAPVRVTHTRLATPAAACAGRFVAHELDHITTTADGVIRMFEANGAGLAAGDLDGDGDLDLVLGALAGQDTILWNEGGLLFRTERFGSGPTRMVSAVDVDADGRLDLVLTRATGSANYFHNDGDPADGSLFTPTLLPGVAGFASALDWSDLDRDGDLDLVTATYDAGLLTDRGSSYLTTGGGGVNVYMNQDGRFRRSVLATTAQANALLVADLNRDGRPDIWVGNDFAEPDRIWLQTADGWTETMPFAAITHSTMSLDTGDLDNDGQAEFLATDMLPFADDATTQAAWAPVMAEMMAAPHLPGDIQVMANTLHGRRGPEGYTNQAAPWGIDATGWTWSARFGDLDNDGYLDLYVVNGMAEATMFAHLPNHELVEENLAFHNDGLGRLVPAPEWTLNATAGGRGMLMADFDHDGDLDIAVNNLRSPAMLYENQLCGGHGLLVDLADAGRGNTHALGARLRLRTSQGDLLREVRAAGGYLSGDAPQVHFGLPPDAEAGRLEIVWPDGATSALTDIQTGYHLLVERGYLPMNKPSAFD